MKHVLEHIPFVASAVMQPRGGAPSRAERRAAPKPARTPSGGRAAYSPIGGLS